MAVVAERGDGLGGDGEDRPVEPDVVDLGLQVTGGVGLRQQLRDLLPELVGEQALREPAAEVLHGSAVHGGERGVDRVHDPADGIGDADASGGTGERLLPLGADVFGPLAVADCHEDRFAGEPDSMSV